MNLYISVAAVFTLLTVTGADATKWKLDDILKSLYKLQRSPEGIEAEDGRTEGQLRDREILR